MNSVNYIKIDTRYFGILMKIIGITYVAEFSANLCKDSGYRGIISQFEGVRGLLLCKYMV